MNSDLALWIALASGALALLGSLGSQLINEAIIRLCTAPPLHLADPAAVLLFTS